MNISWFWKILKNIIFCVLPETWENETFTFKDVL